MTLKDCYMQMGADYEETVQRLRSESLIQRIILKFPQDPSYQELCQALADGNIERLRPLQETETDYLMQNVTEEYNRTVKAIEDFQNA